MLNVFDTLENPHKEVSEVLGVLLVEGSPVGFRVRSKEGVIGEVGITSVKVEIYEALKAWKQISLIQHGGMWKSKVEIEKGILLPDLAEQEGIALSLQYHIYGLERAYRQNNAANIYEVAFSFLEDNKRKYVSGYVQANTREDAINFGRVYVAQTRYVELMSISWGYSEPFYGKVDWGRQSPLLAVRLTIGAKWNKSILPKVKKKEEQEKAERGY